VYLHSLDEQASGFGLQYLADAMHPQTPASDLPPATARLLGELAGDVIEQEQYLDFACHRTFRRTLLCHDAVTLDRDSRAGVGEGPLTRFDQAFGTRGHGTAAPEGAGPIWQGVVGGIGSSLPQNLDGG